jgi:hypothetical protein
VLESVPPETYLVRVEAPGYRVHEETIVVDLEGIRDLHIRMVPSPQSSAEGITPLLIIGFVIAVVCAGVVWSRRRLRTPPKGS